MDVRYDDTRQVLESLADTLWAERRVVELLLYKLVAAKLFLASDDRRFTAMALDEVERVVAHLRTAEQRRAGAVGQVAANWGTTPEALTLAELARQAPEPLGSVFSDHQHAFCTMAEEIEATAQTNRRLATAALSQVQQALDNLTGPTLGGTYTADGRADVSSPNPLRLDQVL